MSIRFYKCHTPGTRRRSVFTFEELTQFKPEKSLTSSYKRSNGRNNRGVITSQHKSTGHKRLYRKIEFNRKKYGVVAKVFSIEYDPNRNARISLLHYLNGEKQYILHPQGLKINDNVITDIKAPIQVGNSLPLKNIPLGSLVHNIEFQLGAGAKLARAAGSAAVILGKDKNWVSLRLPSGEIRRISKECWATLGQVGNIEAANIVLGKAGRSRLKGVRPKVRGVVKNPVDHPHGGGEGRSPIGKVRPVTAWGKPALGKKTRNKRKLSQTLIIRRRK